MSEIFQDESLDEETGSDGFEFARALGLIDDGEDGGAQPDHSEQGEVLVPLVGLRGAFERIELGDTVIERAEAAGVSRGSGEYEYVARVPCPPGPEAPRALISSEIRQALTHLRLFKSGSISIGPSAVIERPNGGLGELATGYPPPRPGGYRLEAGEADELVELAGKIESAGARSAALGWAVARFELGLERPTMIEALSDYLLALRALLEGGGPARAGLGTRIETLCESEDARKTVDAALALERKLMSGARLAPSAQEERAPTPQSSPLVVTAALEELLRGLLRRMAVGELGPDLRAAADEQLLAGGFGGGSLSDDAADNSPAPLGETAEWRIPDPVEIEQIERIEEIEGIATDDEITVFAASEQPSEAETRIIAAGVETAGEMAERTKASQIDREDWIEDDLDESLEWPAFATPRKGKERVKATERTRHLFPVPDDTDWSVGELDYDRERARVRRSG